MDANVSTTSPPLAWSQIFNLCMRVMKPYYRPNRVATNEVEQFCREWMYQSMWQLQKQHGIDHFRQNILVFSILCLRWPQRILQYEITSLLQKYFVLVNARDVIHVVGLNS